jgi:cell wall-associated NlpC family hydrolase
MKVKNLLPLLFFAMTCLFLARCSVLQQKPQAPEVITNEKSSKKTDKKARLRSEIATYAHQQIGTRYVYAGKNPQGFDCSGFVFFVMKKYDIAVSGSSRTQEKYGTKVSLSNAKAGDLIFFRRSKKGDVFHVAIVYANDKNGLQVVHSTSSRGVVLDNISNNSYWSPKISTGRDVISD